MRRNLPFGRVDENIGMSIVLRLVLALVRALVERVGVALSPRACAACDAPLSRAAVMCASCAASVVRVEAMTVLYVPEPLGEACAMGALSNAPSSARAPPGPRAACAQRAPPRVDVLAYASYGGAIATAVSRLKYADRPDLAGPLGELLRAAARKLGLRADVVVPVPLHRKRLSERGYNQAALLASAVARELGARAAPRGLRRVRDTVQQATQGRAARLRSVRGAFDVPRPRDVAGLRVVLVDDVITTGATVSECARALFDAGAASVTALVVARADLASAAP